MMCPCSECEPAEASHYPHGVVATLTARLWELDEARDRIDQERDRLLTRYQRLVGCVPVLDGGN
jgi:hypothetical protein